MNDTTWIWEPEWWTGMFGGDPETPVSVPDDVGQDLPNVGVDVDLGLGVFDGPVMLVLVALAAFLIWKVVD